MDYSRLLTSWVWRLQCQKGMFCGHRCEGVASQQVAEIIASHKGKVVGTDRESRCKLVFRGHINWYDYVKGFTRHRIPSTSIFFLTFLRDPVGRAISEYRHITEGLVAQFGPHTFGAAWDYNFTYNPKRTLAQKRTQGTLDRWLECGDCKVGSSNRMARFMAGLSTTGTTGAEEESRMVSAAKENLRRCALIGLMERYEDSMLILRNTFPLGLGRMDRYSNSPHPKTGVQVEVTKEQTERIRVMNSADVELYDYARELFQSRWDSMLGQLSETEAKLRFRKRSGRAFVLTAS